MDSLRRFFTEDETKKRSHWLRLVCWLPVVDEVRTRIYCLNRENVIPELLQTVEMMNYP